MRCHCTACKINTAIKYEDCVESGKGEGGRGRRERMEGGGVRRWKEEERGRRI